MLRLRTLGECLIELGDAPLSPEADVLFTVLLYLCAERDRRLSRGAVAELFWPGLPPRRARHCLRQVLYRLRALGLEVEAEHEYLRLSSARIAPGFAAAPSREQFERERRAGTLVLGPFLGGHVPEVSPAFAEWFDRYRGHLHFHVRRVLLEVAREHRLRGEWGDVEWLSRECLRLDPLNEEATLALAESMAMVGGKAEAIAYLDRYIADLGGDASTARLPATVLRRRIAERFPTRRYAGPADRCFVGRATLLATVATAILRARNRDGGALLLWGAAGIGKSRLAAEAAKIAVMEGVRILRVPCEESASARPLAVFLESLPELLTYPGAIGCAPTSLALLRRLLRADPTAADDASEVTLSPGSLRRAVIDLVDAVTHEVPVLLLVEDAQWADPTSWALLRDLVEWSARKPVLLVFTSRTPHPTPLPPARVAMRLERHELPPLDDAAAMELVRAVAAEAEMQIPDDAAAWCLEAGEGNPLFLQELAGHWLETGQTRGTPPSLQMLLEGRLARLTPTARRVLQAAVVLGRYATPERLAEVLGLVTHVIVAALDELAREQLIVEREDAVATRHDAVALAALAGLKAVALRLLHRRSAGLLEREIAATPALELLVHCYDHWARGSRADRACDTLAAHLPRILLSGPPCDPSAILERALREAAAPKRHEVIRVRAVAEIQNSRWDSAKESLDQLTTGDFPSSPNTKAADLVQRSLAQWRLAFRGKEIFGDLLRVARSPDISSSTRLSAATLGLIICDNEIDCDSEVRSFWEAVQVAEADCPTAQIEHARASMVYNCGFGAPHVGLAAARSLLTDAQSERSPLAEARSLTNVAEAERMCGSHLAAIRLFRRAYDLAVRVRWDAQSAIIADKIASVLLDRGEADAAAGWYSRAIAHSERAEDLDCTIETLATDARLGLAMGNFARVANAIERVTELSANRRSATRLRSLVTLRAELALNASDGRLRPELLEDLLSVHSTMRLRARHDRTAGVAALALLRAGDKTKARSLLSAYLHHERRGGPTPPEFLARLLAKTGG